MGHIWKGIFVFGVYVSTVQSLTYHCDPGQTTVISGQTTGTIQTVESSQTFYSNNLKCSWIINGGANTRIQLNVTGVDLQWAPTYTLCTDYDNLQIRDGNKSSSRSLLAICGSINPYEVVSSGQYLHLTFSSNEKNFYDHTGVTLNFEVFSDRECPEGWRELDDKCYKIETRTKADWNNAQILCGYSQSNLVTIHTDTVFNFIQDFGKSISLQSAWIGLNDVTTENIYEWLNGTSLQLNSKLDKSSFSSDKDCFSHDFTRRLWVSRYCARDSMFFICQRYKVGNTEIYVLPQEKIEDGKTSSISIMLAVILGILVGIVVIIGIVMWYCFCILKRHERQPCRSNTTETDYLSNISQRQQRPAAPGDIEIGMVTPPSYDEAMNHDVIK